MTAIDNTGVFLVQTLFNLYLYIIMLRLLLGLFGASFHNPVTQFAVKLTDIFIKPLQRIFPTIKGFNFAVVVFLLIIATIKFTLLSFLANSQWPNYLGVLVWMIGGLGRQLMNLFFYAILLRVILSWLKPHAVSPIVEVLFLLSEPLLRPIRRFIPLIGGFDLTPLAAIIILQVINMLVFNSIATQGMALALS